MNRNRTVQVKGKISIQICDDMYNMSQFLSLAV